MLFVRLVGGCFVYLLLAIAVAALLALGVYLIAVPTNSVAGVSVNRTFAIILGAILIAFSVLLSIGLCCYGKRIRLAAVIVEVSARFVKENCIISVVPFALFLVMAAFITLWVL